MITVKLGSVCEVLSGFAFKSSEFGQDGMPIVRIRDVTRGFTETFYSGCYEEQYLIDNGDILIGMDGDFNLSEWKGGKALLNQRVCKLIVDENVWSKKFLFYFLPQKLLEIWHDTPFVTVKHLSVKKIVDIDVPYFPLEQQKKIAAILEKAEQLCKDCRQMEQELNHLAEAVFLDMFGNIASNPKNWRIGCIGELMDTVSYGTSEKSSEEVLEYPVLRMNNITYDGGWDFTSLKYMNMDEKDKSKFLVKKGDILFNRTNSKELVGKTAVFREEQPMAYAGYLVRARCNKLANPEYVSAVLNSKYGKQTLLAMCKSIVGMANINAKEFQTIKLPIPPISLQDEFAVKISQILEVKNRLVVDRHAYYLLFDALVKKAFHGELFI